MSRHLSSLFGKARNQGGDSGCQGGVVLCRVGQIAARLPGIIPLSLCLGVDAFPVHKQAKALARLDRL